MDKLEPIDRQALWPVLGPHAEAIEAVDRAMRRLYGLGALGAIGSAAALTLLAARAVDLRPLQVALLGGAALLAALAILRGVAGRRGALLRARFEARSAALGADQAAIVQAARRARRRWPFFTALWDKGGSDGVGEAS